MPNPITLPEWKQKLAMRTKRFTNKFRASLPTLSLPSGLKNFLAQLKINSVFNQLIKSNASLSKENCNRVKSIILRDSSMQNNLLAEISNQQSIFLQELMCFLTLNGTETIYSDENRLKEEMQAFQQISNISTHWGRYSKRHRWSPKIKIYQIEDIHKFISNLQNANFLNYEMIGLFLDSPNQENFLILLTFPDLPQNLDDKNVANLWKILGNHKHPIATFQIIKEIEELTHKLLLSDSVQKALEKNTFNAYGLLKALKVITDSKIQLSEQMIIALIEHTNPRSVENIAVALKNISPDGTTDKGHKFYKSFSQDPVNTPFDFSIFYPAIIASNNPLELAKYIESLSDHSYSAKLANALHSASAQSPLTETQLREIIKSTQPPTKLPIIPLSTLTSSSFPHPLFSDSRSEPSNGKTPKP